MQNLDHKKTWPVFIVFVFIVLGVVGYFCYQYYLDSWIGIITNQTIITPSTSSTSATRDWKTYTDDQFKMSFKYPSNWTNEDRYFSPAAIKSLTIGTVNAPVYYEFVLASDFNSSSFKYEINNDKRKAADTITTIDGKNFQKYDLIDYGKYEGESAGRVLMYLIPISTSNGKSYYLVFHWEEMPALQTIAGNDPKIFEEIVSTLKFDDTVSSSENMLK